MCYGQNLWLKPSWRFFQSISPKNLIVFRVLTISLKIWISKACFFTINWQTSHVAFFFTGWILFGVFFPAYVAEVFAISLPIFAYIYHTWYKYCHTCTYHSRLLHNIKAGPKNSWPTTVFLNPGTNLKINYNFNIHYDRKVPNLCRTILISLFDLTSFFQSVLQ